MSVCEREKSVEKKRLRTGLVHVYTGQGKGKTTAAIGLAVRAAGHGLRVLFVQFFKLKDDPSGEKEVFERYLDGVELVRSNVRHPLFTGRRTDHPAVKRSVVDAFELARKRMMDGCFDMVVLDEIIGAVNGGYIDVGDVIGFLDLRPEGVEVVLTGRDAPTELVMIADYVTEMLKIKHPYDGGTKARKGIEF